MTTYPQHFMYMVDQFGNAQEVINGARTAANLLTWGSPLIKDILVNAGCAALALQPCVTTITAPVTVTTTSWTAADLSPTGSPWYDGSAESLEGLGLYVTDWTGLDGSHQSRAVSQYATSRGGAWFGPNTAANRVMKLNVNILGQTERGCNYIFRWLEQQLFGCCGGGGTTMWMREYCPDITTPSAGLARMENVALIQGITWESQPMEDSGCFLRTASFTLSAGDPCMYRDDGTTTTGTVLKSTATALATTLMLDTTLGAPCGVWTGTGVAVTAAIPVPRYGASTAVVTIDSSNDQGPIYLPPMRIVGYVDRLGVGTTNPCLGTVVSQLLLVGIPAGVIVEIDMARKLIRQRGGRDDYEWVDATGYVKQYPGGGKKFASFSPCDAGAVTVEPFAMDYFHGTTANTYATSWDVTIVSATRFACAC